MSGPGPTNEGEGTPEALPFDRLGGCAIEREIGRGGTSAVFLARDESSGAAVALKVFLTPTTTDAVARARLELERHAATLLQHPGIVRVLRSGHDRGFDYFVVELVDGPDLAQVLAASPPAIGGVDLRDHRAVAHFFAQIADALAFAHAAGIVHRDVKPSNVLVGADGRPRLTDFGLARDLGASSVSTSGAVVGTYAYMSPEQARGERAAVDARSDVFSLGVVLYEVLTGVRPFAADAPLAVVRAIVAGDLRSPRAHRPDLPRELETICLKALEPKPSDRYPSARALADDLLAFADGRPIAARSPSVTRRLGRTLRRRRVAVVTVVALVLAGIVGATGGLLSRGKGTLVELRSTPAGVEVHVRRMTLETGEYGAPERLGTTPLRARLESGPVRLIFLGRDRTFVELARQIPAPEPSKSGPPFLVEATLVEHPEAVEDMILIPGGRYRVGLGGGDPRAFGGAEIEVLPFWVDRLEVTVGEYRRFLDATGRPAPPSWGDRVDAIDPRLPATGMTGLDAQAYAEWAGKRLLTVIEWESAARGPEGRLHPWDDSDAARDSVRAWACVGRVAMEDYDAAVHDVDLFGAHACAVGSHPRDRSPFGLLDVLGSAMEWTDSPWRTLSDSDVLLADPSSAVLIGFSWAMPAEYAMLGARTVHGRAAASNLAFGFRCARSVDPLAIVPSDGTASR